MNDVAPDQATDMVITLTGYRGTGKSSVGPQLAARLGWDCADADVLIEADAGQSIREIFENEGEAGFRTRERDVMVQLLARERTVIAAGGGAILNEQTRRDMRAAGPVVWLKASPDTIMSRLDADLTTSNRRPALTSASGRHEVERLLAVREPWYRECADVIVETDGRDLESIVDEILAAIAPRLTEGAAR